MIPNFIAGICFYRAGIYYEKVKLAQNEETKEVLEKAEQAEISF